MEANPTTDAKPTPGKSIPFDLDTTAITNLATEFFKPEKLTPLLQKYTTATTDLATKYLKPEKLTPLVQEHKSGIIVAALWLTRSLLSVLPLPIPSLSTLPLVLLALASLSLTTPPRTPAGLAYHAYTEVSSSITSLTKKTLPAWLPRAIPIVLLFPVARAATLLFVFAAWQIVSKYRDGVAGVSEEADQAIRRAVSAAESAREHVREAKGLEMQAMQLAAALVDDDETWKATVAAAREVKTEVEGMVRQVGLLGVKVDKVRKLAEKAKVVAEEGDLELAREVVVNVGKLEKIVVQVGEKVRERVEKVEGLRGRLWELSLGDGSG